MKKYLILSVVLTNVLFGKSQNKNQLDSMVSLSAFINLPLQPHKKNIDIFFNCDKPKQPFYNIKVIDVQSGSTYQDLLNKMQNVARNEGFDGVIILGKSNYLFQDNSLRSAINDNRYGDQFTNVNVLSAIGIKYKNNMQYINKIVKKAVVKTNGNQSKIDTAYFTINDDLVKDDYLKASADHYDTLVHVFQKFDYFATHAMHESASKYVYDSEFSTTIKEPSRYGITKYKIIYANDAALHKIQIRVPTSDVLDEAIFILYDVVYDINADKNIDKRYIRLGRKAELVFTDSYHYDTNKRCTGFTRYDEKAKSVLLQVNFEYFTMSDLPRIY